jgi:hypothetical protein
VRPSTSTIRANRLPALDLARAGVGLAYVMEPVAPTSRRDT